MGVATFFFFFFLSLTVSVFVTAVSLEALELNMSTQNSSPQRKFALADCCTAPRA